MNLRSWFLSWSERRLTQKRDELQIERDRLATDVQARGIPLTMSDVQYATLKQQAEAAGPAAMQRFQELAKAVGRDG